MNNKIALINLGCPKALVDAEEIVTQLIAHGYKTISDCALAALVIVNTCGFINDAIEESLGAIKEALQQNSKVIVTGCLGANSAVIYKHFPNVLAVTGPHSCSDVIAIVIKQVPLKKLSTLDIQNIKLTPPHYAYLKIAEGCNQSCSYCIIPKLRGKLVSRPMREILDEAERLVTNGVKEIIVVAQDTLAYGSDFGKPKLFLELAKHLGDLGVWIRLHYLYPYPFLDELLPLMATGKILPYLDVPLQHFNPRILRQMRRPASSENILQRIQYWRSVCPHVVIRSTFIVGFPSETDEEYAELLNFLEAAQLDRVGCFKYSQVEGAVASGYCEQIAESVKEDRMQQLMSLQQQISSEKLANRIGQKMAVLVDEVQKKQIIARSYGDSPEIDGLVLIEYKNQLQPGDFAKVKILDANEYDLFAIVD